MTGREGPFVNYYKGVCYLPGSSRPSEVGGSDTCTGNVCRTRVLKDHPTLTVDVGTLTNQGSVTHVVCEKKGVRLLISTSIRIFNSDNLELEFRIPTTLRSRTPVKQERTRERQEDFRVGDVETFLQLLHSSLLSQTFPTDGQEIPDLLPNFLSSDFSLRQPTFCSFLSQTNPSDDTLRTRSVPLVQILT